MTIQLLPPQLANQIAAGEVVERPASVIKELVENSLDAGATEIHIDVEKGGSKLLRVRDNGHGIAKEQLTLALSRHATSKIHDFADLARIVSLGFRGEALASISSVSRLTLTSKPALQDNAWQAMAEGRDMAVQVKPASHPVGSSVEVLDLFFNTPARRRFLKSDKTEFGHIDELVKRLALSRYDVSWTLTHNGQIVRQLKSVSDAAGKLRRIQQLCGRTFAQSACLIQSEYEQMQLHGWVLPAAGCTAQLQVQYCYVNGRMMRDKLLNHAIRQAYADALAPAALPAFVLYLDVDPEQVDVNVHPAKHEVRFHQARLVHDFVFSALSSALRQAEQHPLLKVPEATADRDTERQGNSLSSSVALSAPWQAEQNTTPYVAAAQVHGGNQHYGFASQLAAAQNRKAPQTDLPKSTDYIRGDKIAAGEGSQHHSVQIQRSQHLSNQYHHTPYEQPENQAGHSQFTQIGQSGWAGAVNRNEDISASPLPDAAVSAAMVFSERAGHTEKQLPGLFVSPTELLLQQSTTLLLLDIPASLAALLSRQFISATALLLPERLRLEATEISRLTAHAEQLCQMGFDLVLSNQVLIMRAVPKWLQSLSLSVLFPAWWAQWTDDMTTAQLWRQLLQLVLARQLISAEALVAQHVQLFQSPELWHAIPIDLSPWRRQLQEFQS